MAKVKDSEYQFNSPFSLSKRIVCYLIDSLLLILAVILCFQATDLLYGNYNARLKELTADMTAEQERLIECFSGSGLMLYDEEEGVAVEDELMGQYLVYSLVLSTLGEDVSDASAYEGEYIFSDMGTTNRSVIYYYTDFKPAHAADYTGYDESEAGAEYAIAYMNGETDGKVDYDVLKEKFDEYAQANITLEAYTNKSGETFDNVIYVLGEYYKF